MYRTTRRQDGDDNSNNKRHLQQARMEDNIETQETAVGSIQSTSSPTQMKDLETLLPSPLRHQIAKVGARSNNPYFHEVQKDNETDLLYMHYTSIPKITVQVSETDFFDLVSINTEGPKWNDNAVKTKAVIFRHWIEDAVPEHLAMVFDQAFCLAFPSGDKKPRGRPRKHSYLIGIHGYCSAKSDGCKTTFTAGFAESSLRSLLSRGEEELPQSSLLSRGEAQELPQSIALEIDISGSCCHVKDKLYGGLRGTKRQDVLLDFADRKQTPAEFGKHSLSMTSDDAFHSSNRAKIWTKDTTYNLSRESKAKKKSDSGLSNCKLANLMLVKSITDECDVKSRVKIEDTSTDLLGILRLTQLTPSFAMYLWTKSAVQLFHHLGKSGKLIINADAPGIRCIIEGQERRSRPVTH